MTKQNLTQMRGANSCRLTWGGGTGWLTCGCLGSDFVFMSPPNALEEFLSVVFNGFTLASVLF